MVKPNCQRGARMEFLLYMGDVFTPINFGLLLIGTIGGLILGATPGLSPTMAVALLTTLYGAMLANMVAIPFSDKLQLRMAEEELVKSMSIDAVLAIQAGQNPRVIESMLRTYLPESKRGSADEE